MFVSNALSCMSYNVSLFLHTNQLQYAEVFCPYTSHLIVIYLPLSVLFEKQISTLCQEQTEDEKLHNSLICGSNHGKLSKCMLFYFQMLLFINFVVALINL